jgi:hypothetical protein
MTTVSFAEMLENPQLLVQLTPKNEIQTFYLLIFKYRDQQM